MAGQSFRTISPTDVQRRNASVFSFMRSEFFANRRYRFSHAIVRSTSQRCLVDTIFNIAQTGCQQRSLRKDFPPRSTVQQYFYARCDDGLWQHINHALLMAVREAATREASPAAGVVDSQSVKTTEPGHGPRPAHEPAPKLTDAQRAEASRPCEVATLKELAQSYAVGQATIPRFAR